MMDEPLTLSKARIQGIIWTLLCLMPIVGMAIDLVAPSLPAIAFDLQTSAKISKDLISIYLLGYALGNFVTGFMTDAWGRQKLIRISILSFLIFSLLPVIFPKIEILLLARFLQGLAIGAVSVLIRAIISDVVSKEKLIQLGTLIGAMWGLGPVLGPVIGGYLQFYFGWKAGFCFFAVIAFLGFVATWFVVPETHFNLHSLNFENVKKNMLEILRHRLFMSIIVLMGLIYSLIITFNTIGPFLIQTVMKNTPVFFGHMAFSIGIVFLGATFISRYSLKFFKIENMYLVSIHIFFILVLITLMLSYFFESSITLIGVSSAIVFFASGFTFPLSMGKGLSFFQHISGTATAIMYLVNILITSVVSFSVGFVPIKNISSVIEIYALLLFLACLLFWFWMKPGFDRAT